MEIRGEKRGKPVLPKQMKADWNDLPVGYGEQAVYLEAGRDRPRVGES